MLDRVLNTYLETIPKTGRKILYVHVDVQIKCAVKCNYSWSVMNYACKSKNMITVFFLFLPALVLCTLSKRGKAGIVSFVFIFNFSLCIGTLVMEFTRLTCPIIVLANNLTLSRPKL